MAMTTHQTSITPEIYDPDARVVFFPVRHHSPACARLIKQLIHEMNPDAVLIEGPADYNAHIHELFLEHRMPIAIYSFAHLEDGTRRGAFYPFCVYSPEWQAIQTAHEVGAEVQFIDLPWAEFAGQTEVTHRYADNQLEESQYIPMLCDELGVDDFDGLWDKLFEIDETLSVASYLERAHQFMWHLRITAPIIREHDIHREYYMAGRIQKKMDAYNGRILVVTGGFHSSALFNRLFGKGEPNPAPYEQAAQVAVKEQGIALTPYSYQRLDNLKGYESGMPNPGFYHHIWYDTLNKTPDTHRKLISMVAQMLRNRNQPVSSADLIAVETTSQALATLRGHTQVWRRDLIDGIISALVKDELIFETQHPFLQAIFEVFRGNERGKLAEGATLPPLVSQIQHLLEAHDLSPDQGSRNITLDLTKAPDLERSRILHQMRVLRLPGYILFAGGSNLQGYSDVTEVIEKWIIGWSPEFEAACIEATIYGPTLLDASKAALLERAEQLHAPDAAQAAGILLDAALMGLPDHSEELYATLEKAIYKDSNFLTVAQALSRLLYLYRFDNVLGTLQQSDVGDILRSAFQRALWLLESLGVLEGEDQALLNGVRALLDTFERCAPVLNTSQQDFTDVFERVSKERMQTPVLRGATSGVLLILNTIDTKAILANLRYFADPDQLGDFLTGLFFIAREKIQRQQDILESIDVLIQGYDDDSFLVALPSMRLAFSYFTPREKHYIARTLFDDVEESPLAPLEISMDEAAQVMAFESALYKAMEHYGIILDD